MSAVGTAVRGIVVQLAKTTAAKTTQASAKRASPVRDLGAVNVLPVLVPGSLMKALAPEARAELQRVRVMMFCAILCARPA